MTECNGLPLTFSRLGRRKIQADFNGGQLTSDAGAMLLREVDRHIGLIDGMVDCLDDPRDPAKITHDLRTILAQRVFAIAMGYEDGNDHHDLRNDPLLQLITERGVDPAQPLASPSTICRVENGVDRPALVKMVAALIEQFIASYDQPPARIVLDFDATDDPVHGNQEGRFFHGYYDRYCFLPLYVFCGDQLLAAYLRPLLPHGNPRCPGRQESSPRNPPRGANRHAVAGTAEPAARPFRINCPVAQRSWDVALGPERTPFALPKWAGRPGRVRGKGCKKLLQGPEFFFDRL